MTEWGLQFPEEKIEAARKATRLDRFASVEVSWRWFVFFPFLLSQISRMVFPVLTFAFAWLTRGTQDVADQVRLLALSKSMTGQNIVVDSGTTL